MGRMDDLLRGILRDRRQGDFGTLKLLKFRILNHVALGSFELIDLNIGALGQLDPVLVDTFMFVTGVYGLQYCYLLL
jgi:hypothetical protein